MARPRTFDADKVLDAARDVFWRKGYQATSLDDITAETGLNKPSLYAAFGDKRSLFMTVLDRYHDAILAMSERVLASRPTAREAIEAWLMSFVPYCSGERGARGCFSVNASIDGGFDGAELHGSIARYQARLEAMIRARLEADRARFPKDFDPRATAQALLALQSGMLVRAWQKPTQAQVKSVIAQAMQLVP